MFFYRNAPEGKTVNLSIANDVDITFGEIGASPITSLDNIISSAYVPLINQMDPGDWGECDEEQV